MSFEKPDYERFPALRLAFDVLEEGGVKPAVLNAANEVAVASFLDEKIGFTAITRVVAATLQHFESGDDLDLDAILAADARARILAKQEIKQLSTTGADSDVLE